MSQKILVNGNNTPKWKLDHIELFASTRSAHRLAREISLSAVFVYQYCEFKGLKLLKRTYDPQPIIEPVRNERFIRFRTEEKVKEPRPPAKYDNPNWQDRINQLIEMKAV
jgi:hypothetical protein